MRLQRLRLSGDLGEIRAADLAFTAVECRELLGAADHLLTDGDVETLRARTEGWAAGIRLASLSLADEPDPSGALLRLRVTTAPRPTTSSTRCSAARARNVEFLLRTSVPDRLSVELAERLTRRRDAGRMLAELRRQTSSSRATRAGAPVPLPRPVARVPPGAAARPGRTTLRCCTV